MLVAIVAAAFLLPHAIQDTSIAFGIVERDLSGDTIPEVLSLTGVGRTIDGGDAVTAIAWSASDGRFYPILECC